MGYYSDVALCLTKVGAAQLATAIEARVGSSPENFASSAIKDLIGGEPVCKDAATGAVAFFWSCISGMPILRQWPSWKTSWPTWNMRTITSSA